MSNQEKPTVLMVGGGTGGHVYPGIALAREIERLADVQIEWVGTPGRVESWAVPRAGYPIDYLDVEFIKGRRGMALLKALLRIPGALLNAWKLLRSKKPAAVIGLGGFVSGPVCMIAGLTGRNVYLLEQNARPGITNRLNGKVAKIIFATFDASKQWFSPSKVRVEGNPIRRELFEEAAAQDFSKDSTRPIRILVVGGSQGSLTLNREVPARLKEVAARGIEFEVRHASGKGRLDEVRPNYAGVSWPVDVVEYIDDMAAAYAWADMLICRAGATTISELTALGLPALYVPFPFAADDHQSANAQAVVDAGGGWKLTDQELSQPAAADLLAKILGDREELARVAVRAQGLGKGEAGANIAAQILADARIPERALLPE